MQSQSLDWGKIREIFELAQQIDRPGLESFLRDACGDDARLTAEVKRLLAAETASEDEKFLEHPAILSFAQFANDSHHRESAASTILNTPLITTEVGNEMRIGAWRLGKLLGRGGMGAVYLAFRDDGEYRQQAALKVLNPGMNSDIISRFRQERQILADLNHPNIARILDGGTLNGKPWAAMEYVEGQTLRSHLSSKKELPQEQIIVITKQLCAGLGAAHSYGIVHRDIKPENIMVGERNNEPLIKILDFGISKFYGNEMTGTATVTGVVIGTPAYMSPEQASGVSSDKIDARSDIYSVGVILYEMLTGRVPFEGKSVLDVLFDQREKKPIPPSQMRPDLKIPRRIEAVALKALEKDPQERQLSVHELMQELEAACSDVHKPEATTQWKLITAILLLSLLLSLVIYAGISQQKQNGTVETMQHSPKRLQYGVFREMKGLPPQLLRDSQVYEGDKIFFEFRVPFQAETYLFYKQRDGGLVWVNPTGEGNPQINRAGEPIRAPENAGVMMGKIAGLQQYIVIFVPKDQGHSLEQLIDPSEVDYQPPALQADFPHAFIASPGASKVARYLDERAIRLNMSPLGLRGELASQSITAAMTAKAMYQVITLEQRPK